MTCTESTLRLEDRNGVQFVVSSNGEEWKICNDSYYKVGTVVYHCFAHEDAKSRFYVVLGYFNNHNYIIQNELDSKDIISVSHRAMGTNLKIISDEWDREYYNQWSIEENQ